MEPSNKDKERLNIFSRFNPKSELKATRLLQVVPDEVITMQ